MLEIILIIIIIAFFITLTICLLIKTNNAKETESVPTPKPSPPPAPIPRTNRQPIIVIPGLAGTNLDFTIDESFNTPACNTSSIEKIINIQPSLWFNPLFLRISQACYLRLMEPVYDEINKTLTNYPGLNVFPSGNYLGDPISSYCLGYVLKSKSICYPTTDYSKNFIDFFTSYGYKSGRDLFVLGYDWRLVPYEPHVTEYFASLTKLVENTYTNTGKRVNLIGHSLGTSLITIFLNKMPQEWKDTYVESFMSISPAYDGGPKALRTALSGFDFDFPTAVLNATNQTFREFERVSAGNCATLPLLPQMYGPTNENHEGNGDAVILVRDCNCLNGDCGCRKLYNVNDYENGTIGLLRAVAIDSNNPTLNITADILQDIANQRLEYGYTDPNVKVYQISTQPIPTESGPYAYNLSGKGLLGDPLNNPTVIGDQTIPLYGSFIPSVYGWKDIVYKIFPPIDGLDHYTLYQDAPVVYQYILNIVAS